MRITHYIYSALLAVLSLPFMVSCDDIAEADRVIAVEAPTIPETDPEQTDGTVPVFRAMLIEEFSGQFCTNCPEGAEELEEIAHQYGDNNIIVVSIHCGVQERLGLHESNTSFIGLATDFGEQLYSKYGRVGQPAAVIARSSSNAINRPWGTAIATHLETMTPLTMKMEADYDAASNKINVKVMGRSCEDISGNLHVWLTESGIVTVQRLADGGYNYNHVFNHIFRASLTPFDGMPVSYSASADDFTEKEFSIPVSSKWKVENMTVVAFVDNAAGVRQTVKAEVVKP